MWQRTPAPKRGEIMFAFAHLMAEHKERLARAMTREMGKVLSEARGDVQEGIDIAYLMAGEGRRMSGDTVPSELPDKWAMSIRQPIGIAGIITPWNFPMAIPCWKMMPALVAGNVVVFKPASDTPHCATLLVELMAEAGIPPGVVNLVTGTGGEVGDAIVESPDISVISFTGSSATGKAIAVKAGARLKRLAMELGGKNGVVVLADADLDLAADGILWSAFGTTGQRCTACSRVIVERSVVDGLLERLETRRCVADRQIDAVECRSRQVGVGHDLLDPLPRFRTGLQEELRLRRNLREDVVAEVVDEGFVLLAPRGVQEQDPTESVHVGQGLEQSERGAVGQADAPENGGHPAGLLDVDPNDAHRHGRARHVDDVVPTPRLEPKGLPAHSIAAVGGRKREAPGEVGRHGVAA
jgi:hypothetical protein